jgi:hypothetical protein
VKCYRGIEGRAPLDGKQLPSDWNEPSVETVRSDADHLDLGSPHDLQPVFLLGTVTEAVTISAFAMDSSVLLGTLQLFESWLGGLDSAAANSKSQQN